MTPEERAKKLAEKLGFRDSWPDDDAHEWAVSRLTDQIRAACDDAMWDQINVDQQYWREKVKTERERCAKVADGSVMPGWLIAKKIRALAGEEGK